MDFDDSSSDRGDFAGFNLNDIEVHEIDFKSELFISDNSVSMYTFPISRTLRKFFEVNSG